MHKGVNITGQLHAARENVGETWLLVLNLNLEIVIITDKHNENGGRAVKTTEGEYMICWESIRTLSTAAEL